MKKRIIISENQYRRVFLEESSGSYNGNSKFVTEAGTGGTSGDGYRKGWAVPVKPGDWLNYRTTYNIEDLSTDGVPGNVQKTVAKLYRLWANSSNSLSLKYGKKSKYDLDETSNTPYNQYFLNSYKAGKSEFDNVWLASPGYGNYIMLSKAGDYRYTYQYKKNEWYYATNDRTIDPTQQIKNPNETLYYLGDDGIGGVKKIWDNSVKSTGVKSLINRVNTEISNEEIEKNNKIASEQANIESVRKFLTDLGFDYRTPPGYPDIMPKNPLSGNHLYAQSVLNATRYITSGLIADKVITAVKGDVEVCVTSVGSTCAPPLYYTSKYFDYEMGKMISSRSIGGNPAQFVVYLSNFYFDFSKLQKDLDDTFKGNKYAYKSTLFPDGWWNWFVSYFGTDNLDTIINSVKSIASYDIPGNIESINDYEKGGSLWSWLGDCFSDYHCVLDIASIVTLAIPGVGPIVSMGLDFVNAGAYGVEAINAETSEESNAALLAGGLTLFGGILGGGVKQTRKLLTAAEKNPKIYDYAGEVISRTEKELPTYKNLKSAQKDANVTKIYKETAEKYGLTNEEILVAHDIIKDFSKIDLTTATKYTDALNKIDSKVGRANLRVISNNSKFKQLVLDNNGDVVKSLSKFMKTQAGKEAITELGLFIVLTEALEEPVVQEWISEAYNYIKYAGKTDIKSLVEKEGYEWKSTKEIFGSNGTLEDNVLLTKAWNDGWRPYEKSLIKSGKEITIEDMNYNIPEKYQTKTFKDKYSDIKITKTEKIELAPVNSEEMEEGVKYYEEQEHIDMLKQPYKDWNEEEEVELKSILSNF